SPRCALAATCRSPSGRSSAAQYAIRTGRPAARAPQRQATGDAAMNPLDQLAPLIAPAPVSWRPPAPGWRFRAAGLLGCLLLWRTKPWQRRKRREVVEPPLEPQRQIALDELAQLSRPYDGQPANQWLQQLNALLKRLCRIRYPEAQSHTLSGRA